LTRVARPKKMPRMPIQPAMCVEAAYQSYAQK
jgi:hypothetical protein